MRHSAPVFGPVVFAALVVATLHAGPARQEPATEFRSGTDLVQVDVSVLDRDRRPVGDLTAGDFTIFEDGKPRPVVAFSAVNLPVVDRSGVGAPAPWLRDAPFDVISNDVPDEGRLVTILIDGSIPHGQPTVTAKRVARASIEQLGPGDLAAVVRSSIFDNNGLAQAFTADRSLLFQAIDSPFMGTTAEPNMTETGLQSPSPVPGQSYQTKNQCEVISDIARAMQDAPRRRKMLIVVGSNIVIGGQLTSGADIRPCRDEMLRQLALANLTVQVVDPVGLLTTSIAADYRSAVPITPGLVLGWRRSDQVRLDDLRVLPDRTGGRLVAQTNDPEDYMPAIFAESQSYYLLGFEPASAVPDGRLHTIRVEVARRDVTVRSRTAYVAESDDRTVGPAAPMGTDAAEGLPPDLAAALDGALPRGNLPLSVTATAFAAPDESRTVVAVVLGAVLPPVASARRLHVAVGAFDGRGRSVDLHVQTVDITSETGRRSIGTDGLPARLRLPPGRYELRAAVRDEATGNVGSVFSFVDVPEHLGQPLSASGLVLRREGASFVSDNPLAGIVPGVPTVARTFGARESVGVFLRIYQSAETQAIPVAVRIVDAADHTAFEQHIVLVPDRFVARAAGVELPLPLDLLTPGHYLLTIRATRGEVHVDRHARFEVAAGP